MPTARSASVTPTVHPPRHRHRSPYRTLAPVAVLAFAGSLHASAQAPPPAGSVPGDLQVGGGYTRANPDYSPDSFNGFAVFADADFTRHFGVVAELHRIAGSSSISETTYAAGGRFRYPVGHFEPYLKIVGGAGSFNSNSTTQNGTYAQFAGGGGLDYRFHRHLIFRADYEYQRWSSFLPSGLQPNLFTLGALYRLR